MEFVCQKCRSPLEIDSSLLEVNSQFFSPRKKQFSLSDAPNSDNSIPQNSLPANLTNNISILPRAIREEGLAKTLSGNSTLLSRRPSNVSFPVTLSPQNGSNVQNAPVIDNRVLLLARLFELASDASDIDHPLCTECALSLSSDLHRQIIEAEGEAERYTLMLNAMEMELKEETQSMQDLDQDIERLEQEERELRRKLEVLDKQRIRLTNNTQKLLLDTQKIELIEQRYWENFNAYDNQVRNHLESRDAVLKRTENVTALLDKLKHTDAYNDTFHISYDGHFGTINAFRLGRLPSQPVQFAMVLAMLQVDWTEINAAFGQACLLLHTIAFKLKFTFSLFQPIPMGSQSMMVKIDDNSQYELFFSSDITFGKLFWFRRYDTAMVAFLRCLKEIGDHIEKLTGQPVFPAKILGDKIRTQTGDNVAIKRQFNDEENWTRALKYVLINLKFLVAWLARNR